LEIICNLACLRVAASAKAGIWILGFQCLFGSGYAGLGFICYNKGAMRKIYIREG